MRATKMRTGWFGLMTLAVGALALAGSAHATTFTWAGGASGTWDTTGANWAGVPADPWDSANGPGNIAGFNTAAATPSVSGTVYAGGITFIDTATIGGSGTINLAGSAPNLAVNPGVTGTIDSAVNLIPSSVWISSSSGNLIINGKISGSCPNGLFLNQSGTTTLNNPANDFTSGFSLMQGTLSISSIANNGMACALGNSGGISFGHDSWGMTGKLQFTGASGGSSDRTMTIWGNRYPANGPTDNGGIIENTVSGQTLALSGGINTAGDGSTPSLQLIGAGNGVESGVISGSGLSITKSGAGIWALFGNNTYTGPTTVNGGTLVVAAAGSIQGASTVSVNAGAVLALGQAANSNTLNLNNGTLSVARDNTGTGGTITYAGGNVIHTFTAAGASTLSIPEAVSASVLVVAGGGGGGSHYAGGGGAGGLLYYGAETPANGHPDGTGFTIPAGVSSVTVGDGGAGASPAADQNGSQGGDSVFATLTALGGGGGGGNNRSGADGGSGGGAGFSTESFTPVGGSGTAGQGNGGGPSSYGGGGGAGVAATGGYGGDGLPYSISGTPTWYAGGGGGINAWGGQGGGAYGSQSGGQTPVAGVANRGGGGGGGWGSGGGDGGSGIVIVSYPYNVNVVNPNPANAFNATTLSGTITVPATSTLDAVGSGGQITVASGMSGAGGINIASSGGAGGVVVYSAAQAYTGATTISNGATLRVTLASALPTVTDVSIASGAKLDLAFEGTNTVRTLSIDGVLQERNRVYGSVSQPQALGGTGFLKVTDGAAPKGTMILVL